MKTRNRTFLTLAVVAMASLVLVTSSADVAHAALVPVFTYDADNGTGTGTAGALPADTAIPDQSTAGNDSDPNIRGTATAEDDPYAVAGELSFSFAGGSTGLRTANTDLMTSTLIANNGGFTWDVWFKTTDSDGMIISSCGTDALEMLGSQLLIRNTDTDGVGAINHGGGEYSDVHNIGASGAYDDGAWHHAYIQLDSSGNVLDVDDGISGTLYATMDGGSAVNLGTARVSDYGDVLNRNIGVGMHPGYAAVGITGLIYDPKVSLGVAATTTATPGTLIYGK